MTAIPQITPSTFFQTVATTSGFVIKPAYMLLNLYLLWRLWGAQRKQIRILWWGLLLFFVGEAACAVNYIAFGLASVPWEMAHDIGMVLAFAFINFVVMDFVDCRILFASVLDKPCALLRFCKGCPKAGTQPDCNLKFVYKLIVSLFVLLAFFPLSKPVIEKAVNFDIFGTSYVKEHLVVNQLFEKRVYPGLGLLLLLVTLVLLFKRSERAFHASRYTFAAGLAFVGFGIARTVIYHANLDNLLMMDFWEEATELAFIVGILLCVTRFPKLVLGAEPDKEAAHG